MNRLTIDDIPADVKRSMIEKWEGVEWGMGSIWAQCALCDFLSTGDDDDPCSICPLVDEMYCVGHASESRLHLWYHASEKYPLVTWANTRDEFVAWLKESIYKGDNSE